MTWLVTNMWIALAAVSLLGLLLGWSFRGAMLLGRARRAQVERDVLKTELHQAEAEIEGLYKAQRNGVTAASGAGDEALRGELEARERKLGELSSELAKSKAALEQLMSSGARQSGAAAAGAGIAGAAAGAIAAKGASRLDDNVDPDEASLVWRNRHLESRVRHLEGQIQETAQTALDAPAPTAAVAAATVGAAGTAAALSGSASATGVKDAQNTWQLDYLRTRVGVLENELAVAPVAMAAGVEGASENEELANLRWRNRNLERKLAYFEGGVEETGEGDPVGETAAEESAEGTAYNLTANLSDDVSEANESILTDIAPTELEAPELDMPETVSEALEVADLAEDAPEVADFIPEDLDVPESALEDAMADQDNIGLSTAATVAAVGAAVAAGVAGHADEAPSVSDPDTELATTLDDAIEDQNAGSILDAVDEVVSEPESFTDRDEAPSQGQPVAMPIPDTERGDRSVASAADLLSEETVIATTERPLALAGPVAGTADDLTVIGGVGPKIEQVLNELGIFHFDQVAAWSPENVAWVDDHLSFSGRIARERWVEQAQVLVGEDS